MILEQLAEIPYGYGFRGQDKTFKARYKAELADLIINKIPTQHHLVIKTYKTKTDHCFIGVIAPRTNIIWVIFEQAVMRAKGEILAKQD